MMRQNAVFYALFSVVVGALQACSCQPSLPPPASTEPETTDTTTTETAEPTSDTGEKPCSIPEMEPNNAPSTSTILELEQQGCGVFSELQDLDYWQFVIDREKWIAVDADATSLGSLADVNVLIDSDQGFALARNNDEGSRDSHLMFLAPAGAYTMLIGETTLSGDDDGRYFYEIKVSQVKPPIFYHYEEEEPNSTFSEAMFIEATDRVFGVLENQLDIDWYAIEIPPGRHHLQVVIEGYSLGSPADTTLYLYNEDQVLQRTERGGLEPGEVDPVLTYNSNGNETLYIQVREAQSKGSPAHWYMLTTTVETF